MDSRPARFEALVLASASDLYRYAVWLGNGTQAAEDLVQQTFLRAWKALDSLREARAARGWLVSILRREHARQFERRARRSLRWTGWIRSVWRASRRRSEPTC